MNAQQLAALFGLATVGAIVGCDGMTNPTVTTVNKPVSVVAQSNCELRLELPATIASNALGHAKLQIKNAGKSDVTLVKPGDGSECHWRTPIVGWSILSSASTDQHPKEPPRQGGARCGNINPLTPDEVFTLKPGETRELNGLINFPNQLAPGKYRVVFYYSNIPQLEWHGVPLGTHDAAAMRGVIRSTGVALVSNEVELVVTENGNTN